MNVNPVTVNIDLKTEKQGKWYGDEKTEKNGDKTVSFYQRDGKRTFLQKIKDFKNGVRYGTELARKYSKELGLPKEAMSSVKNKSEKRTISNTELNTLFRAAHEKLQKNEFFKKSEPLVSHTNEKIKIKINDETTLSKKDYKDKIENSLMQSMASHQKNYQPYGKHVQLALDIHVSGNSHASNENIGEAINALTELRNVSLNGKFYRNQTIIQNDQTKFNETVDMLIASLNTALKKTNNDSTSN